MKEKDTESLPYINTVTLVGRVVSYGLEYSPSGKVRGKLLLEIGSGSSHWSATKTITSTPEITIWGRDALLASMRLKNGAIIAVDGKIVTFKKYYDGEKHTEMAISANRFSCISRCKKVTEEDINKINRPVVDDILPV